jgi:hypothetical protein
MSVRFRVTTYRMTTLLMWTLAGAGVHAADDPGDIHNGAKELSGMSILGNSEAPKSLVIVPWKSSEIGDGIGIANMLDGRARPVDRDVFVRELGYYELRTTMPAQDVPDVTGQQQATD